MHLQTIETTAEQLCVHPRTVRRMVARGEIVAVRVGNGRILRIDADSLAEALRPIPAGGAA